MKKHIFYILVIVVAFGTFLFGFRWSQAQRLQQGVLRICRVVEKNFFRQNEQLIQWLSDCRSLRSQISIGTSREEALGLVELLLSEMAVSHFGIYPPVQNKLFWQGEYKETGLRLRRIEGHWMVVEILPGSPAAAAGLKVGDEILAFNDSEILDKTWPQYYPGDLRVQRDEDVFSLSLSTASMIVDQRPTLHVLDEKGSLAYLRVSTYREAYFDKAAILDLGRELKKHKGIVLDLRGNPGGNFVAMLRILSLLHCTPVSAGKVVQGRKDIHATKSFVDDITQKAQLDVFYQTKDIEMNSFLNYPCTMVPMITLVDNETGSVAEMMAQSLKENGRSTIWGLPTAGDVLLSVWYDLPEWGADYSFAVPEAYYLSQAGKSLENEGVMPDRFLDYTYSDARQGVDSWVRQAAEHLKANRHE